MQSTAWYAGRVSTEQKSSKSLSPGAIAQLVEGQRAFLAFLERRVESRATAEDSLRYAESIPKDEVWAAHTRAKADLLRYVHSQTKLKIDPDILTIGFARRFTAYKRPDLIFGDTQRLERICRETGRLQIICAGKAHPSDHDGKLLIQRVCEIREMLQDKLPIVYLTNYDMDLAQRCLASTYGSTRHNLRWKHLAPAV